MTVRRCPQALTRHPDHGDPVPWSVDEVIECLDITTDTRTALHRAAPDAYRKRVSLRKVWRQLAEDVQDDIIEAFAKNARPL